MSSGRGLSPRTFWPSALATCESRLVERGTNILGAHTSSASKLQTFQRLLLVLLYVNMYDAWLQLYQVFVLE